jgi:UDP-N-acetylmuramoyl-tripeptide--D-alanyl-D-alanine ligase
VKIALAIALSALLVAAYCAQMARWLRVLQREHYDPTSLFRFFVRWSSFPRSRARVTRDARAQLGTLLSYFLILLMIVLAATQQWDLLVVAVALYGIFCPVGLSIRGRTSTLDWTRRLRMTACVAASLSVVIAGLAVLAPIRYLGAIVMVLAVNPVLDLVTRAVRPLEERHAQRFVDQAVRRLAVVGPRVVAITGSYGKTSTKNHLSALLGPNLGVVASPRSFNNRAGLSRAINENLADGTRIFIADGYLWSRRDSRAHVLVRPRDCGGDRDRTGAS